jgi:hypothetical protein
MTVLTTRPRRVTGHPGGGSGDLPLPRPVGDAPREPRNQPLTRVFVLAPTRTSAITTKGVSLSMVTRAEIDEMLAQTRKPSKAQISAAYWAGKMADAENGAAALGKMWSWVLAAITALDKRDPRAAESARYHLSRGMALLAAQLPESKFEFRVGLTEDEAKQLLFDPWVKQERAS